MTSPAVPAAHLAAFADFCDTFKPRFDAVYTDQYEPRERYPTFAFLAKRLIELGRPVRIVECGTARYNQYDVCGQSTEVFDWLAQRLGGCVISIDHDGDAVEQSGLKQRTKRTYYVTGRALSVVADASILGAPDLFYLDLDWTPQTNMASQLEHVGALAAAWPMLPAGCLVALDDCYWHHAPMGGFGKHGLCFRFFADTGLVPVFKGFTSVWKKP